MRVIGGYHFTYTIQGEDMPTIFADIQNTTLQYYMGCPIEFDIIVKSGKGMSISHPNSKLNLVARFGSARDYHGCLGYACLQAIQSFIICTSPTAT